VHRFLAVWGTALLVVAASAPIATVTASGPINISGAAVPATAASSAPLGLGDRISTIDSPALIRFEGRGVVTLDKRSSVQIVSRGGRTMICLLDGAYLYKFVAGSAHMGWVASAVVVLALLSWAFASRIPQTTPSAPDLPVNANPWTSTVGLLKTLYADKRLWDGTVIVSWFWLVGAIVLSLLPALVKDVVGGTEGVVTLCLATFAIGIAIGSLFAASLSHVRPNLALVPIGAIIMGFAGLDLAFAIAVTAKGQDITAANFATSFAGLRMLADFVAFAFGGGLFVVPSFAAVQLTKILAAFGCGGRSNKATWPKLAETWL